MKNQLLFFEILLSKNKYHSHEPFYRLGIADYTRNIKHEGERLYALFEKLAIENLKSNKKIKLYYAYLHRLEKLKVLCETKGWTAIKQGISFFYDSKFYTPIINTQQLYKEILRLIKLLCCDLNLLQQMQISQYNYLTNKNLLEIDNQEILNLRNDFFFRVLHLEDTTNNFAEAFMYTFIDMPDDFDFEIDFECFPSIGKMFETDAYIINERNNGLDTDDKKLGAFCFRGVEIEITYAHTLNILECYCQYKYGNLQSTFFPQYLEQAFPTFFDTGYNEDISPFQNLVNIVQDSFPDDETILPVILKYKDVENGKTIIEDWLIYINYCYNPALSYFVLDIQRQLTELNKEGQYRFLKNFENRIEGLIKDRCEEIRYKQENKHLPPIEEYLMAYINEEKLLSCIDEEKIKVIEQELVQPKNSDETYVSNNSSNPEKITFLGTVEDLGLLTELLFNVGLIRNKKEKSKVSRVLANSISTVDKENISADYLYNCFSSKEFSDKKISDMKTKVIKILEELNNLSEN